jgi:hypothetical protein
VISVAGVREHHDAAYNVIETPERKGDFKEC